MPELHFKGKEYVFNHHLTVPFRPLVAYPGKSILASPAGRGAGAGGEDRSEGKGGNENLIIHGDNLHALKALLPRYAGKVDCVFIDPPYNTGNENWNYNDNVNSPIIKEWLDGNPVNKEDMLRHDKWCCMMYPRLKLLHELLSENGSLWITLDDNEFHRAQIILDEMFSEENFVANISWHARKSLQNDTDISTNNVNYLIGYAKNRRQKDRRLKITNASTWAQQDGFVFYPKEVEASRYSNPDNDERGPWKADPFDAPKVRKNLTYEIINPNTKQVYLPPDGRHWRIGPEKYLDLLKDDRIVFGKTGNSGPQLKVFAAEKEEYGEIESTWWDGPATATDATIYLRKLFSDRDSIDLFETPKPTELIAKIVRHTTKSNSIVLDSFAGSGTTAHAVLAQNAKDGGNRRFILVECEDYADSLTAERVRRVVNGYEFQGVQKEELLREKITWSNFSGERARRKILDQVDAIKNLDSSGFDSIKSTIKNGELIVTGENRITEKVEGLGGGFTYYTLGEPIDLDKMLTGESLPDYISLGAWLFHTATGEPLDEEGIREKDSYLGESAAFHAWLIYKPDLDFLKSRESALTLDFAEAIAKNKGKRHLVFASSRFASNKTLSPMGVEFAPLPFALYRLEKE